MSPIDDGSRAVRLALPKGRMQEGVFRLLTDAGIPPRVGTGREYRPAVGLAGVEAKILKPQSVVEMLQAGSRDVGFAGADWVAELDADLVELVDTELDPVRIVAAAPREVASDPGALGRTLEVASEYERLTRAWIARRGLRATFVRSWGATEVLPPEDADIVVDNTQSGATLAANDLCVMDEVLTSSTRLYASRAALEVPEKRATIDRLVLLLRSVLDARSRAIVEVNVAPDRFDALVDALPCMREPTVSTLHGGAGFAVKVAVPRRVLAELIPEITARGGTDILVSTPERIVS